MMVEFFKNNFKPSGIYVRVLLHIFPYIIQAVPLPISHFLWIDCRLVVVISYHDMVKFMLGKSIVKWCFVNKGKQIFELGDKAHFLFQSSFSGRNIGFAHSLMATTSVCPQ